MREWEEGKGVTPPLPSTPQSITRLAFFLAVAPLFTFFALLRALSKSQKLAGLVIFKLKE